MSKSRLMIKGIVRALVQTGVFAALLFIAAGTWHWPRALQFLVAFGVVQMIVTAVLARLAPASLEARVQTGSTKNQPVADRIVTLLLGLFLLAWFVFMPIDVFRLQVLPRPALWVSVVGVALLIAGYGVMVTAVWQNAFATPIVGDQSERNQAVIDTGLYGRIRHPMYLGLLFFLAGLALWLQSYASVILLPVAFLPIIARIVVEEKTLRKTLPGYVGYMSRVRYRLVPFIW